MPVIIRDRDMRVVRASRTTTAIVEHNRVSPVERVDLWPAPSGSGGQLGVSWQDGSTMICDWPSHEVCLAWCHRQAAFVGRITVHPTPGVAGKPRPF
jgi:hypothetical protein